MSLRKITKKEWIEKGLPESVTNIHIGPYYQWDDIKKDFKKPILILTKELPKKNDKK
jgi:hypothetical protein